MAYPNINDWFREAGKDVQQNIPHVVIGNPTEPQKPPQNQSFQQNPYNIPQYPQHPYFTDKKEDLQGKVFKWAVILGSLLVIGYASYRIIKVFFLGG